MRRMLFKCLLCIGSVVAAVAEASTNSDVAASNVSTNDVRNPVGPAGRGGGREESYFGRRPKRGATAKKKASQPKAGLSAAERKTQADAERAAKEAAAKAAAEKAAKEAAEKAAKEAAERAEAERKKRENTPAHWVAARNSLSFGSRMTFRDEDGRQRTSVVINGEDYTDGDLVEIVHDSRRFTWRYEGLTNQNKLSLKPIKAEYLETSGESEKK